MKRIVYLLAAYSLHSAMAPPARAAEVEISFDYFYDSLQPSGEWIYSDDYGYCWSPVAAKEEAWRPYTDGYWAWTDNGWTWVSNEEYGSITYHYGRWTRLKNRWWWVPGFEWAPAWVSWRQTDQEVGWAPLPPEAQWVADTGFRTWTDSHYDIGPTWYNFVRIEHFAEPQLVRHLVATTDNIRIMERSENVTNIIYKQNVVNNIFVGGPELTRIERAGGRTVKHLTLRQDENFRVTERREGRDRLQGFSRIEGSTLVVAAPQVRRDKNVRPPEVRIRYDRQSVDRGWGGRDRNEVASRLHEKFRAEAGKQEGGKLPPRMERPPLALAPPSLPAARDGGADRPRDPARPGDTPEPAPGVRPGVKPGTVDPSPSDGTRPPRDDARRPGSPDKPAPDSTKPQPADSPDKPSPDTTKPQPRTKDSPPQPGRNSDDDPNRVKPSKPNPDDPDKTKPREPGQKTPPPPESKPRREKPDDANDVKPSKRTKEEKEERPGKKAAENPSRPQPRNDNADKAPKRQEGDEKPKTDRDEKPAQPKDREPQETKKNTPPAKEPGDNPGRQPKAEEKPAPKKPDADKSEKARPAPEKSKEKEKDNESTEKKKDT